MPPFASMGSILTATYVPLTQICREELGFEGLSPWWWLQCKPLTRS